MKCVHVACWLVLTNLASTFALSEGVAQSSRPDSCTEFHAGASDLPRLGRLRGAWLGPGQFVLADLKRHRLLAYDASSGGVESVRTPVGESWRPGVSADQAQPTGTVWAGDGVILALHTPPAPDSWGEAHLVFLSVELVPMHTIRWPSMQQPSGQSGRRSAYSSYVAEVLASEGRLALRALRGGTTVVIEFTRVRTPQPEGLREDAVWPPLEGENPFINHLPVESLAATEGAHRAMYALRFARTPFIQVLGHGEMRRLSAFPEAATPLPALPPVDGWGALPAFYTAAESAAWPVGLYGQKNRLYVLAREVIDGATVWNLHHIDPVADEVVGRTELPTNAAHVSLLPGEKHWVLEESSSRAEDMFRQPVRLLLLDAEAVRAGGELQCD